MHLIIWTEIGPKIAYAFSHSNNIDYIDGQLCFYHFHRWTWLWFRSPVGTSSTTLNRFKKWLGWLSWRCVVALIDMPHGIPRTLIIRMKFSYEWIVSSLTWLITYTLGGSDFGFVLKCNGTWIQNTSLMTDYLTVEVFTRLLWSHDGFSTHRTTVLFSFIRIIRYSFSITTLIELKALHQYQIEWYILSKRQPNEKLILKSSVIWVSTCKYQNLTIFS